MKKKILQLVILTAVFSTTAFAQKIELPKALKNVTSKAANVSSEEAGMGIKEALTQGITNAVLNLNKTNGFLGSDVYKLLLPPDAVKVEKTLRKIGMGDQIDKAITAINRGAEEAVGFAKPIFVAAIKEMTIADALKLLSGKPDAATNYFKEKTSAQLVAAFNPSVSASLEKAGATKYYADIVTAYNKLPTTLKKLDPDLTGYVVNKSVDALFDQVAKEEANIRENPAARGSELLKKVFGGN